MELKPILDHIIVKLKESPSETKGGILIPEQYREKKEEGKMSLGTIIALGPGRKSKKTGQIVPMNLKVGQTIMFHGWAGLEHPIMGKGHWMIKEEDVDGVVE
jgi:chaperonin GroES